MKFSKFVRLGILSHILLKIIPVWELFQFCVNIVIVETFKGFLDGPVLRQWEAEGKGT